MKKYVLVFALGAMFTSCSSYTADQGKAAQDMCDCMENDEYDDFDINWAECDLALKESYDAEVTADEGWIAAITDKCPTVAKNITQ
ncbi:hypothetical protein [Crocinitomix catalasitica]|uniref:hypothetical protein n=1 Tax=Crocinitomix catalasitica TaxID=184607 RepID=UPI000485B880|nr:hypothetical protein [Crocinitomix catalasitica]